MNSQGGECAHSPLPTFTTIEALLGCWRSRYSGSPLDLPTPLPTRGMPPSTAYPPSAHSSWLGQWLKNSPGWAQTLIFDSTLALWVPQPRKREAKSLSPCILGFGGSQATYLGCQVERNEGCWVPPAPGGNRSDALPGAHPCPPR